MAIKPTDCYKQLDILKERKLRINTSDERILKFLTENNYFRFKGYFSNFMIYESDIDQYFFKEDITFEEIESIYYADTQLRRIVVELLESIEIYLRTIIVLFFSNYFGDPYFIYESSIFYQSSDGSSKIDVVLNNLKKYVKIHQNSKIVIDSTNLETGECKLPSWAAIDLLSFGDLSILFESLLSQYIKDLNKKYFNFPNYDARHYILSWSKSITRLRNICHHYEQLYKIELKNSPPKIYNDEKINEFILIDNKNMFTVYNYLLTAVMMCPNKQVTENLIDKISFIQNTVPYISLENDYGFPTNWSKSFNELSGHMIKCDY